MCYDRESDIRIIKNHILFTEILIKHLHKPYKFQKKKLKEYENAREQLELKKWHYYKELEKVMN